MAIVINRIVRGFLGRRKAARQRAAMQLKNRQNKAATVINSLIRSFLARARVKRIREERIRQLVMSLSVTTISRWVRGFLARRLYFRLRTQAMALVIQRVFRGHLGRKVARFERDRLEEVRRRHAAAVKIQVRETDRQGVETLDDSTGRRRGADTADLWHCACWWWQGTWRMKVTREEYKTVRVNSLAATEVQRVYRCGRTTANSLSLVHGGPDC